MKFLNSIFLKTSYKKILFYIFDPLDVESSLSSIVPQKLGRTVQIIITTFTNRAVARDEI